MRIRSTGLAFVLVSACGATCLASGTRLAWEASVDGGVTYSNKVNALPGQTVFMQMHVSRVGTETVLGLAGLTFQTTLSNWRTDVGDALVPWQGEHMSGLGVLDLPQNTGKLAPFGQINQYVSTTGSGVLTGFNDPGNTLRIAGANAVSPTMTVHGISIGQRPQATAGTWFRSSLDVVVFRYSITLGSSAEPRTLEASSPAAYIHFTGRTSWYQTSTGLSPVLRDNVMDSEISSAMINVVPGPATTGLVLTGLLSFRRRRSR